MLHDNKIAAQQPYFLSLSGLMLYISLYIKYIIRIIYSIYSDTRQLSNWLATYTQDIQNTEKPNILYIRRTSNSLWFISVDSSIKLLRDYHLNLILSLTPFLVICIHLSILIRNQVHGYYIPFIFISNINANGLLENQSLNESSTTTILFEDTEWKEKKNTWKQTE